VRGFVLAAHRRASISVVTSVVVAHCALTVFVVILVVVVADEHRTASIA
jgi:hypothetical protein